MPETREDLDLVGLDPLARTSPVSLLAPTQVSVDRALIEHQSRGQAAEDRDERRAVRLAGGGERERHA
jgi:hypothetical protein